MGDRQNTAGYPAIAAPRRALPKLPRRQLQTPHFDRTTHDPLLRSGLQNRESQVAPMGTPKRTESQEFRRLVLLPGRWLATDDKMDNSVLFGLQKVLDVGVCDYPGAI